MFNIKKVHGTVLETNNYIIENDIGIVLIETSANIEHIKKEIGDKKVFAILLTHGHWDHFYYLQDYIKEFDCKVYLTEQAFQKINYKEKTFCIDRNPKITLEERDVVFIKEKDVLKFGKNLEFTVIETKGHTDCSVSYLLNDQYLFSGDTLFEKAVGRCDLPTGNDEEMKNSLSKLSKLKKDIIVYPGHGNETTIEKERYSNE